MKALSPFARLYVLAVILAGGGLLVWNFKAIRLQDVWLILALSGLASLSLIFKVEGATSRSHYNVSFVIYAFSFVVLGAPETMLVILVSNLAEWIWRKYPWYIQSFNISSYLISLHLAEITFELVDPTRAYYSPVGVLGLLVAMAAFTLLNHLLVGGVVWLARGENLLVSGLLDLFPLTLDFILLVMGAGNALVWIQSPYAVLLTALPLYLIYNTLKVPALERQTEIDPKTGLFNARYLNEALESELNRANQFDRPLSVVMADMDLLRQVNNNYGHLAGDIVLVGVADIFKQHARNYDIAARFGGEEYAILMPETSPQEAYERVEKIRKAIENTDFSVPTSVTPIKATMSFGIAARDGFKQMPSELLHNADAALYHAKLKGRNRAFIYSSEIYASLFQSGQAEALEANIPAFTAQAAAPPVSEEKAADQAQVPARPPSPPLRTVKELPVGVQAAQPKVSNARPAWAVNVFIGLISLAAMLLFSVSYYPLSGADWLGLCVFTLLVVITEWMSVDIYVRNTAVSTSAAPLIAGTILYGPLGAALLSLAFALVAKVRHNSRWNRFLFNLSNQLLAALLVSGLVQMSGTPFIQLQYAVQLVLSLLAGVLVYLSTTSMIAMGMHLDADVPFYETWKEQYSWLAPYYAAMGLLAYALIFSYQAAGFTGVLVILVPLLLLRVGQKQYIDRTRAAVNELKETNVKLRQNEKELNNFNEGLLDMLAELIDLRDPYVRWHSRQVSHISVLIAQKMHLPEKQVDLIRKAGMLHDIGKLGISTALLRKPSTLTREEFEVIKGHPHLGANLLETSRALKDLVPIIRHHHERYDGMGYPDGLQGESIPLLARIVAIADAIEAMASDRPYRNALMSLEVLDELRRNRGTQFDPAVVDAFLEVFAERGDGILENSAPKIPRQEDDSIAIPLVSKIKRANG